MDASTLLNLANGEVLELALMLPHHDFVVSSEVRKESKTIQHQVDVLVETGFLEFIDDTHVPAARVSQCMTEWELGAGECECIVAADQQMLTVACDDQKARSRIARELGRDRLWGTIGILKALIATDLLTPQDAFQAYSRMREAGGFLPALDLADFQQPA